MRSITIEGGLTVALRRSARARRMVLRVPHAGGEAVLTLPLHAPLAEGERIRILLPGNIDTPKGRTVIAELLAHDTEGRLEIHILGRVKDPAAIAHPPRQALTDSADCHDPQTVMRP